MYSMSEGNVDDDVIFEPEEDGKTQNSAQKMKKLREERDKARKERDEYLAGWQRSKADYVNLQRRMREASSDVAKVAVSGIVGNIIPVFDSLEAARKAAENAGEGVQKGIDQVVAQLQSSLKEHGVLRFQPKEGDAFDPERHEPMQTVATEDKNLDNTVHECYQSGFELGGTIIRPARVAVRKFQD